RTPLIAVGIAERTVRQLQQRCVLLYGRTRQAAFVQLIARVRRDVCHGLGSTDSSAAVTVAMSERRDKSSTPAAIFGARTYTPSEIAKPTASGSSYSPRADFGTRLHASTISGVTAQQFMPTQRARSDDRSSLSPGFSTMPSNCWSSDTSSTANERTRSGSILLSRTSASRSNAIVAAVSSSASLRYASTG